MHKPLLEHRGKRWYLRTQQLTSPTFMGAVEEAKSVCEVDPTQYRVGKSIFPVNPTIRRRYSGII